MVGAQAGATAERVRSRGDFTAALIGLVVIALGMLVVRDEAVPDSEESVFRFVNDLPGALYPLLYPLQQLGAIVIGPILAVGALLWRRYRLAAALLMVTVGKLVSERLVKAAVTRRRPATSVGSDIELRGDVSTAGESFVSGHAMLAAGLAMVIAPYLPGRWKLLPWILAALVAIGRVYVGAHLPLDVICGAAVGIAIGAIANLVFGVPSEKRGVEPIAETADGDIGR